MSDADDAGFDKEAERERLREKYEREQADREAAQQMSDLLLKGATMTNAHCGQCGSPIFRVDGNEFCPNCSADATEATTEGADAADAGDPAGGERPQTDSADEPSPDEQLADVIAGNEDDDAEPATTDGTSMAERAAASVESAGHGEQSGQASDDAGADPARSGGDRRPARGADSPAGDASLADAQQSLLNAITHHARAATDTDPRTARDHLEAAGEAAEALAELSQ